MSAGRNTAEQTLSLAIRTVGCVLIAFFTFAFFGSVTNMTEPGFLYEMLGWGSVGDPEEQMISAIYIIWGVFLWRAASRPFEHSLFIEFSIAGNAAHFATMLVQALVMGGEHGHLYGDVLLWGVLVLALALPWYSAQRRTGLAGRHDVRETQLP